MKNIELESALNKEYDKSCNIINSRINNIDVVIAKLEDVKNQLKYIITKYQDLLLDNSDILNREEKRLEEKGECYSYFYDKLYGDRDKAHVSRAIHNLEDDLRKFRYNM